MFSLEEEPLESEELRRTQSRKLNAQAGLGMRPAGPLDASDLVFFLLNLATGKPREWGKPGVQKVL